MREQMCCVVGSPRSLHFPCPLLAAALLSLSLSINLLCGCVRAFGFYSARCSSSCCCWFSSFFFAFHVHFLLSIEFNGVAPTPRGNCKWASAPRVEVDRSTWSENHARRGCAAPSAAAVGALGVAWLVSLATNRNGGSICSPLQLFHSTLPLCACVCVSMCVCAALFLGVGKTQMQERSHFAQAARSGPAVIVCYLALYPI